MTTSSLTATDHDAQHKYDQSRRDLCLNLNEVLNNLIGLRDFNKTWPIHYPTPPRPTPRPKFQQSWSNGSNRATPIESPEFSDDESMMTGSTMVAGSSMTGSSRDIRGSMHTSQQFSVLKLDLDLFNAAHMDASDRVRSLGKEYMVASLMDEKIGSSVTHLRSLLNRMEDTSSKILVTGDLNAGKSTFCNALVRRKVLPADEMPCTNIFTEVLDSSINGGVEEVHAVHRDAVYNRRDRSTYDILPLDDLETLVVPPPPEEEQPPEVGHAKYAQCKVYIKDARPKEESLLHNGIIDIALIDSPGLNTDTTKTTAIFARQEEIDVVVFLVSAMNQFTQTSTQFIRAAAAEKDYLFVVVNRFDAIRNKERCRKIILDKIESLSPATFKEADDLVHFVSAACVPIEGEDDPRVHPTKELTDEFAALEDSLKRFVLGRRARSKLAPARTYMINILKDIEVLGAVNADAARAELEKSTNELGDLDPRLEQSKETKTEVTKQIHNLVDKAYTNIEEQSSVAINEAIQHAGSGDLGVPYPGLFGALQYAEDLKDAMVSHIMETVLLCEDEARTKTVKCVNIIKQLGMKHVGTEYQALKFDSEIMYQDQKDEDDRHIEFSTELSDFIDLSTLLQSKEQTGMAVTTVATVVGAGVIGNLDSLSMAFQAARLLGNEAFRWVVVRGVLTAAVAVGFLILRQIPKSLPHRLTQRIAAQLEREKYVDRNAKRISTKARKVLRYPTTHLITGLDKSVNKLEVRRHEIVEVRDGSRTALKYFTNLVQSSAARRRAIEKVDLDGLV
ncbi:hypothetical protein QBC35DRAFT_253333 [Podospora australis]|uniref:Dynamin-type G domain-containing protein n=1 Tax=Podospora australis TaxID=1536484 RepID=A0AAN6WSY4_9PEZI|nr:hypothetical protein QBC35DRAFT_253333 [Podospora australis]